MKEEKSKSENEDKKEIERIKRRKMREMEEMIKEEDNEATREGHPLIMNDNTFTEIIKKYPLVVVDCWAPWCAPCRMVTPIIEELAKEYNGKVTFGKLNIDENLRTATEFGIMAIPTLLIFKNGRFVDNVIGALPKRHLEAKIKEWM